MDSNAGYNIDDNSMEFDSAVNGNAGISNAGISNAGVSNAGVSNAGVSNAGVNNAGANNAGVNNAGVNSAGINTGGINNTAISNARSDETGISDTGNSTGLIHTDLPENKGISSLEEIQRFEVLRTEMASSMFKPKMVIGYESISFTKACVQLLADTLYINILIDRQKQRIIVLPVHKHAKDALRWCNMKDGEIVKRTCTARKFGEKLYEMMHWVKENKYRILAYYQKIEEVRLLVFNLNEYEMVVPEFITTKTGKVIKHGKVYHPSEWEKGFGMPLSEHSVANNVELNAHYTLSDKDKEVRISDVKVIGKVPTEEEIIMSQYRKEKTQEVFDGVRPYC